MNLPKRPVFLFLFVALAARVAAGTPGVERLNLDHDVPAVIDVTPVAERWNGEGFMPVRVRIENRGREPLAWGFSFNINFGHSATTLTHDVRLGAEPGSVSETVVFLPGAGAVSANRRAVVGVGLSGPGANGYGGGLLHGPSDEAVNMATTAALEAPLFSAVAGAPGLKAQITAVDPALWPADWRVWSPFDRVVLDEREYAALDGARRAALHDWVAMGGALEIYPTEGFGAPATSLRLHGHGAIRPMTRSLAAEAASSIKREVRPDGASDPDDLADSTAAFISPERREEMLLSRGALGVSLFLLAFGVVVGPVNLFVFAPSRRRHRLFFTTPLISLGASLALAGYIVMKDGFGGEGARHGLVWLLPDSNQAVVSQGQISRTGVLLGGGFELPDDVMLASGDGRFDDHYDYRKKADSYSRASGMTGGDWFASRRVQEHTLRRLVPTRARVELVGGGKGGEPPVVQSSVGTVLRNFVYLDARGAPWIADEVAPGQRVTLRRSSDLLVASAPRGCFSARGGAAEGLAPIPTLASIRWDESEFLYAGPVVGARTP